MSDKSKFDKFRALVYENKLATFLGAVFIIAVLVKTVTTNFLILGSVGILLLLCIAMSFPGISDFINEKFSSLINGLLKFVGILKPDSPDYIIPIPGTTFLLVIFAMLLM